MTESGEPDDPVETPPGERLLPNAADRPIGSRDADSMGRRAFAEELARETLASPTDGGYVVALTGAWGSGKTSILNMAAEAIGDDAVVIHFNPWMFSGTEALVSSFFRELSKQLGRKKATAKVVANKLATYGQLLSPVAGFFGAGGAANVATGLLQQAATDPSVYEEHESIRHELAKLDQRLVVIVDDVDRLRPDEVRDIVRLVRLVGDFPKTLYLLAFDRRRVEDCLGEGDIARGRAYLEKIVQVSYDVPQARGLDLTALFLAGLNPIIESVSTGPLHSDDWQNVFAFIIQPLLETPRDVRRYLQALPMTLRMIGDEIALADVLGLEAIRVLRPDMFDALAEAGEALGGTRTLGLNTPSSKPALEDSPVGPLAAIDMTLAGAICKWLFPASGRFFGHPGYGPEWHSTWRQLRKVATPSVFRFYLERRLPDGVVRAQVVDDLLDALTNVDLLDTTLASLSGDQLTNALERLAHRLDRLDYHADADVEIDPAWTSLGLLIDQLPRMSTRTSDSNPFGRSLTIGSIGLQLVTRIPDEDNRVATVRHALECSHVASARIILLRVLGHRPNIGAGILSLAAVNELEAEQRVGLSEEPAEELAGDPSPLNIARLLADTPEGTAALREKAENDHFMMALLVDSRGTARGQAVGAAAVELTAVLSWDHLMALLGEELLIRRVAELFGAVDGGSLVLDNASLATLNLAGDYATGHRPDAIFQTMMETATGGDQQTRPVRGPDLSGEEEGEESSEVGREDHGNGGVDDNDPAEEDEAEADDDREAAGQVDEEEPTQRTSGRAE